MSHWSDGWGRGEPGQRERGRERQDPEETQRMSGGDAERTQRVGNNPSDGTQHVQHGQDPERTQRIAYGSDPESIQPIPYRSRHHEPESDHENFDYFFDSGDTRRNDTHGENFTYSPERSQRPPGDQLPPARPMRAPRRRGPRSVGRKLVAVLGVILLLIVAGFVYVDVKLNKIDALADYEKRPPASPGQNWLLVGSDSRENLTKEERSELNTGKAGGGRTDTIMLMHIPRFGGDPTLVSLPRDSLVDVPAFTTEDGDQISAQRGKLNSAFAFGGPQLLARTVETETGIRIDEYMEVGLGGFAGVVEAVGGVRMCLDEPIHDKKAGLDLQAGCQKLDGSEALGFVRARYFDPRGDFGRVERQRRFLRALSEKVSSPTTLLNPIAMTRLMNAAAAALTVDNRTGSPALAWFGWHMKGLTGGGGVTMTVPVAGTESVAGVGSSVIWDREKASALFEALREDEPVPKSLIPKKKK